MFRNFNQLWTSWTEIPQEDRNTWFKEFLGQFSWLPVHSENLKKAYNFRASKWMSDKLYKLRHHTGKKNWIQEEVAEQLFQRWGTDEKYIKQSERNKLNRARMDGPSYAGGCIPYSEHRRKVTESGEFPVDMIPWVTFERTHSRQIEGGGRHWINAKSQQCADTFKQLMQERASQIENDPTSFYSDNESLFIQAVGGVDKKGRVFGMGASASELKLSMKRSSNTGGSVPAEDKRVKVLEATVREQGEKMREQGEMITEMRALLQSLLKDKGKGPGGGDDTGGDKDQTPAL